MDDYLPLLATFVLAVVFILGSIVTTKFVAPRRPTSAKSAPYESGIVPTREPPRRFPVRFYLVAMIFIIFDIEIIFLFPWATVYHRLGTYGLLVLADFTVPFIVVFVWMVSHGALEWGPVKRARREGSVDPGRTTTGNIRRVGTEGRYDTDGPFVPKQGAA
ncbi:MAG: nuoA [Actinomycetia bacterium]|nr:nuoA [Actinomycetes bacterium]